MKTKLLILLFICLIFFGCDNRIKEECAFDIGTIVTPKLIELQGMVRHQYNHTIPCGYEVRFFKPHVERIGHIFSHSTKNKFFVEVTFREKELIQFIKES